MNIPATLATNEKNDGSQAMATVTYLRILLICLIDFLVSLIATHLADSVLEHYILLEQVVNGDLILCVIVHRALQEEAQEALSAKTAGAVSEVHEQTQVKAQGGCQDRITAQEVDLDLHGITHPAKDVDIVPTLLIIIAGRIIVDAHFVIVVTVQVRLLISHED